MNRYRKSVAICTGLVLVFSAFAVSPAGAITKAKATTQAIKDEAPVYNALARFAKDASKLTGAATTAEDEAVAEPFGNAIQSLQTKLLDQVWPAGAKSDVRHLYSVSSPLVADLDTANAITSQTSASAWVNKTATDLSVWVASVNVVNHDQGLPPLATNGSAVAACQADGATVSVALDAFHAQKPGVTPTEALLTSKADGGPFITNWPHQAHYKYTLTSSGQLRISAPPAAPSVAYTGPANCADAGV
jgi:hypothetical protein